MKRILAGFTLGLALFAVIGIQKASPIQAQSQVQYSEALRITTSQTPLDISWNPTGKELAIAEADQVQIWDIGRKAILQNIQSDFTYSSVAWQPDGTELATLGNRMIVWNVLTGQSLTGLSFPENETNSGTAAWDRSGTKLAFNHWDNSRGTVTPRIWTEATKQFIDLNKPSVTLLNWLSWSPDGTKLAISDYHSATVWDVKTDKQLFALDQSDFITQIAWSPNGKMIAGANGCSGSCASKTTFQVWNASNGQLTSTVVAHSSDVLSISWSPDSDMIASGSADKTIKIWDVLTNRVLLTIAGHTDQVSRVEWNPNGDEIASASDDNTVRIWDIRGLALIL